MAKNSINQIGIKNVLLAFAVSPLLTPATFFFSAASGSDINEPVRLDPMVFILIGPYAYLVTMILGLPAFLIYRKFGWDRLICYSTGGAAIGLLTAFLLFNVGASWSIDAADYVWCSLAGAISATFFWVMLYKVNVKLPSSIENE